MKYRMGLLLVSCLTSAVWPLIAWIESAGSRPEMGIAPLVSASAFGIFVLAQQVPTGPGHMPRFVAVAVTSPVILYVTLMAGTAFVSAGSGGRSAAAAASALGVVFLAGTCRMLGEIEMPIARAFQAACLGALIGAVGYSGGSPLDPPAPGIPAVIYFWQPIVAMSLFWNPARSVA